MAFEHGGQARDDLLGYRAVGFWVQRRAGAGRYPQGDADTVTGLGRLRPAGGWPGCKSRIMTQDRCLEIA